MEIMTAEEARQKHNDGMLAEVLKDITNKIDKATPDLFITIKKTYLTKYVVKKLTLAGYEIKPNNNECDFVSWFKEED